MKKDQSDFNEALQNFLAEQDALPPTKDPTEICRRARRVARGIQATLRPEEIKKETDALIARLTALEKRGKHLSDCFLSNL